MGTLGPKRRNNLSGDLQVHVHSLEMQRILIVNLDVSHHNSKKNADEFLAS